MVIKTAFAQNEVVTLKTDPDSFPRMVTAITIRGRHVQYELSCGPATSWHTQAEIQRGPARGKVVEVKGFVG